MCGEWPEEKSYVMTDAMRELKIRAEILQKRTTTGTPLRRRDCLNLVAREWGFSGFLAARAMLTGTPGAAEFGTLLYPKYGPTLNAWYADYAQARADRDLKQWYLLAYKKDYLVVDRTYVESLGLDPDDADWAAMGFDWVRPSDLAARTRLYGKRIARLERV